MPQSQPEWYADWAEKNPRIAEMLDGNDIIHKMIPLYRMRADLLRQAAIESQNILVTLYDIQGLSLKHAYRLESMPKKPEQDFMTLVFAAKKELSPDFSSHSTALDNARANLRDAEKLKAGPEVILAAQAALRLAGQKMDDFLLREPELENRALRKVVRWMDAGDLRIHSDWMAYESALKWASLHQTQMILIDLWRIERTLGDFEPVMWFHDGTDSDKMAASAHERAESFRLNRRQDIRDGIDAMAPGCMGAERLAQRVQITLRQARDIADIRLNHTGLWKDYYDAHEAERVGDLAALARFELQNPALNIAAWLNDADLKQLRSAIPESHRQKLTASIKTETRQPRATQP